LRGCVITTTSGDFESGGFGWIAAASKIGRGAWPRT
jgi:hypothetical protein